LPGSTNAKEVKDEEAMAEMDKLRIGELFRRLQIRGAYRSFGYEVWQITECS